MDIPLADSIHALWDELADFDAARIDEARDRLLTATCQMVDAQDAVWIGAVRMSDIVPGDPAHGWRPRTIRHLRPSPPIHDLAQKQVKMLEQGCVDATTVRNVQLAGCFRANRLIDLVPESWFDSDYYHAYYLGAGRSDAIWTGIPINPDVEIYIGVFRHTGHSRFSERERDTVAYALRGLKWFHRQQLLGQGLLVANTPLTPVETRVLQGLLAGLSEKQIAAAQGHSYHTTHEYVSNLYRKFGVKNRAALTALWLGKSA